MRIRGCLQARESPGRVPQDRNNKKIEEREYEKTENDRHKHDTGNVNGAFVPDGCRSRRDFFGETGIRPPCRPYQADHGE